MNNNLINRRLLLAKEFYLQAKENSKKIDSVSKMMAIHNFHIAVEISLTAIILKYKIRTDKQLNIDFESMMSEINNKIPDENFPYRQELRSLNSLRGLIQHQAIEPDKSSLDDFEIITGRFLTKAYKNYFDIDFLNLSRSSLIVDKQIQLLFSKSFEAKSNGNFLKSAVILDGLFQLVTPSINSFLPNEGFNSSFFVTSDLSRLSASNEIREFYEPIKIAIEKTYERIRSSENLTAVLSSGVNLSDLKKFQSKPFHLDFSINGNPIVQITKHLEVEKEYCEWAYNFLVSVILLWQKNGLEPAIDEKYLQSVQKLVNFENE